MSSVSEVNQPTVLVEISIGVSSTLFQVAIESIVAASLLKWTVNLVVYQQVFDSLSENSEKITLGNILKDKELFGITHVGVIRSQDTENPFLKSVPIITIDQLLTLQEQADFCWYY